MNNSLNEQEHKRNSLDVPLNYYFQVLRDKRLSKSKKSSLIPADNHENLKDMWHEHEQIRKSYSGMNRGSQNSSQDSIKESIDESIPEKPHFSYLDLKIKIAGKIIENCTLCERNCTINRHKDQGFCRVQNSKIASEFLHMGEEAPLVPSHTIFFTGCSFQCVYCQNWDISQHPEDGMILSEERMANIIDRRKSEGSRNVNFVGGDPNPHLPYILKVISLSKKTLPVIWNSNFYMSLNTLKLLDGVVDLYLTDFKYGNDNCALRLSKAPDYWEVITRNHKFAQKSGDMIIRHLVLPNHLECCTKPILDWIHDNLGEKVVLNIMGQYRPVYGACGCDDISRFIYAEEMAEAVNYARNLGFIYLI